MLFSSDFKAVLNRFSENLSSRFFGDSIEDWMWALDTI
jgi:hypothetical protein